MKLSTRIKVVTGTIALLILQSFSGMAQSGNIRLNQIGFYINAPKLAIVLQGSASTYSILDTAGHVILSGKLVNSAAKTLAGKPAYVADFTGLKRPGKYYISLPSGEVSSTFVVSDHVHHALAIALVKGFYYQRASIDLPEKYAGQWHRSGGHPDDKVLIHPSAVSSNRPAGTVISSPRGWYDAGDYNKYIVNSGISTGTLLSLYEDFPDYVKQLKVNIPEHGNGIPDILNEVLWNLRWMLTMQDPNDGGVYHKLTNAGFDGMLMPDKAIKTRYVVEKSTAATLDFAAVMAQASRIFKRYQKQLPGLSDSCLSAAKYAWIWSFKNPGVLYKQEEMNKLFEPQISTGTYGDGNVDDEWIWAACELAISANDDQYIKQINILPDTTMPIPSWGQVKMLGYYSLIRNKASVSNYAKSMVKQIEPRLTAVADTMVKESRHTAYLTAIGASKNNFGWGSNSLAANQGIAMLQVYLYTHNRQYLNEALNNLDYLLGRNATGYSYVTGYGYKTPMYPHHRVSVADGINAPVPGLMVGGPNPGMQDHIQLPSVVPEEAYIDNDRAYAVNEIAINWNAPIVYLVWALEAIQK